MQPPRVTAQDVALRAQVSQPTVSRVFTPGASVSPEVRSRVLSAAQAMGYRPNTLARSLNTGKSRTVGLVLAYLHNPFYPEALERLSGALRRRGYHVMIFFAANLDEEVDSVVEDLLAHQVDGIILASVSLSNRLTTRLRDLRIPLVLFNRGQADQTLPAVTAANADGGNLAGRFLLSGGHRRLAHISGWLRSQTGRERQAGFLAAIAGAGLPPPRCIDSEYSRELAAEATLTLMEQCSPPDAVFVGNDHMAFAVLETLRVRLRVRVPEDVSVVGFDDVSMAAWPTFDLTTVRQPVNRMVERTVARLCDLMAGENPATGREEIETRLILRSSARLPAAWPPPV